MTYLDSDVLTGGGSLVAVASAAAAITEPQPFRFHPLAPLTERQCEVLALTADGLRAKQVAYRLGLSVRTIEKHKQDIMRKLGLRSTLELLRWYFAADERPVDRR